MILFTYLGELSALLRNNCLYLSIIEVKKKMHPLALATDPLSFTIVLPFLVIIIS